jgi:NAD(P)-dependent dehydrogenase (short-subunit alcohol dehydrogenase family)
VFRLDGKRAVVTGAASGIGLAIARVFAANGAQLALLDLNAAAVDSAAKALAKEFGTAVTGHACDVSDEVSVQAAFAAVGSPIDVLVNSAGIAHVGSLETTAVADMDRLYAVNVKGTYLCMKSAIGPMTAAGKGVILNMASIAATSGLADRFAYSMTKGAVLSMTLSVAKDYLVKGVRCNCISPARVHTPFVDGFVAKNYPGHEAEKLKELGASQPIGRMGRPDEIAALALYLCSDEAAFLTGVDYPIDGGYFNLR